MCIRHSQSKDYLEFEEQFKLYVCPTVSKNGLKKAYAAWRLLCCEINDIPKEWYK